MTTFNFENCTKGFPCKGSSSSDRVIHQTDSRPTWDTFSSFIGLGNAALTK